MLSQIVDAFLANDYVDTVCDDFFNHLFEHVLFFVHESVHLLWTLNVDFCVEFGLLDFKRRVQQCYFRFLHAFRHARVNHFFIEHDTVD